MYRRQVSTCPRNEWNPLFFIIQSDIPALDQILSVEIQNEKSCKYVPGGVEVTQKI